MHDRAVDLAIMRQRFPIQTGVARNEDLRRTHHLRQVPRGLNYSFQIRQEPESAARKVVIAARLQQVLIASDDEYPPVLTQLVRIVFAHQRNHRNDRLPCSRIRFSIPLISQPFQGTLHIGAWFMYSPTATASCLQRVLRAAALMSPAVCSPQLKTSVRKFKPPSVPHACV
jgi:hypothetical protein